MTYPSGGTAGATVLKEADDKGRSAMRLGRFCAMLRMGNHSRGDVQSALGCWA